MVIVKASLTGNQSFLSSTGSVKTLNQPQLNICSNLKPISNT